MGGDAVNSLILDGQTRHCRYQPRRHSFEYRLMWLCIDIDELPLLDREVKCFGHNRRAPVSIRDADYCGNGVGSIREKIATLLTRSGVAESIGRIELITLPRVFGYAFNPVSFFRCYDPDGVLVTLVSEVHNTFGEAHHYVLRPVNPVTRPGESIRFSAPKTFFVSPFLQVNGEYEIVLTERGDFVSLAISLRQEQQLVLYAEMSGRGTPLTTRSLSASAIRLPWLVATVMLRITWQAFRLYLQKHIPVFAKPPPTNAATFRAGGASVWHRIRDYLVRLASDRSDESQLTAPGLAKQKEAR